MKLGLQILVKNLSVLVNKTVTNFLLLIEDNLPWNQTLQILLQLFYIKPFSFENADLGQKGLPVNLGEQTVAVQKVKKGLNVIGKPLEFLSQNENLAGILKSQKDKLVDLLVILEVVLGKQKVETLGQGVQILNGVDSGYEAYQGVDLVHVVHFTKD